MGALENRRYSFSNGGKNRSMKCDSTARYAGRTGSTCGCCGSEAEAKIQLGARNSSRVENPVEKDHAGMLIRDWSISDITYAYE